MGSSLTPAAPTPPLKFAFVVDEKLTAILDTHSHEDHWRQQPPAGRSSGVEDLCPNSFGSARPRRHLCTHPSQPYRHLLWGCFPAFHGAACGGYGDLIQTGNYCFQGSSDPRAHSPDHALPCTNKIRQGRLLHWLTSWWVAGQRGLVSGLQYLADHRLPAAHLPVASHRALSRLRWVCGDLLGIWRRRLSITRKQGIKVLGLCQKGWSLPVITRVLMGRPMPIEFS